VCFSVSDYNLDGLCRPPSQGGEDGTVGGGYQ